MCSRAAGYSVIAPNQATNSNMESEDFPEYVKYIFQQMLYHPTNTAILVCALVNLLWRVATVILIVFEEVFKLLSAALRSPASQVGAGLGGTMGMTIGIVCYGSWSAVVFGLCVGALLGGVTMNGIHSITRDVSAGRELTNYYFRDP